MSKQAARRTRRPPDREDGRRPASDASIYLGLLMIGAGIVVLVWLLTAGQWWRPVALAWLALLALLMNLYAWKAYRGRPLANWKQALARLPLRFAGYGTRHGKPLHAAHNSDRARKAIIMSCGVSVVVVGLLVLVFYPELVNEALGG